MEIDKLKQWLDVAQQYQSQNFWNQIFSEKSAGFSDPKTMAAPFSVAQEYTPKCDLFELDGLVIAEIELPGLKEKDLQISLHDQSLLITGDFRTLQPKGKYFLKERANRKFKKELTLPLPILPSQSTYHLSDGVLVITMPYDKENMESVPITFESSSE